MIKSTFESETIVFDDGLLLTGSVDGRPVDGLGVDIGEEDALLLDIEIDGDDVAQILVDDRVFLGVDRHVADVVLVGENQPRLDVVLALARVLVGFAFVVRVVAFAVVRSWRVGTVLRTHSGLFLALVDVGARLPVGHQSVARVACALVFRRSVDAQLSALVNFHLSISTQIRYQYFTSAKN